MGSITTLAGGVIYLDANLFICALEGLPPFAAKLAALFQRFDRGELGAVTSELTLAEVLVKPIRDNNTALRDQYDRLVRASPALTVVSVTREILVAAATPRDLLAQTPDAIHAATSISAKCTTHLTNDHRFTTIPKLAVMLLPDLP
jgi:predicted nucleic acid-binding protein